MNACTVCKSATVQAFDSPSPHYPLLRCSTCGHVLVPVSAQVNNSDLQLGFFGEEFARREGYFVGFYESINSTRAARLLALSRSSKILEVGPGRGSLMNHFAALGHSVTGLDLSPAVAKQIRSRYGLRVVTTALEQYSSEAGTTYDAVVMRHVLEHFSQPLEATRAAYAMLRPGGLLYVAVPNMGSWHSRWRGWSGFEPYHLQYFGKRSLTQCLQNAGLTILQLGSYESLSGWTNTVLRSIMAPTRATSDGESARVEGGAMRNALEAGRLIFGLLTSPLRWLQAGLLRGEELFAVAQRPDATR